ncbi:MAG: hypothetical protein JO151_09065 [Verrucomicrobia bacterium]|jgi:hypothetical protein|nr:hypothetical protein [Verrucomicrobiota bacterium]
MSLSRLKKFLHPRHSHKELWDRDHFAILEEGDILNNRRRPDLYFIFTEDGLAHWIESGDIVSVTTL